MMNEAIHAFPSQFSYRPVVKNAARLKSYKYFVVIGMGGSNLAPDLLALRDSSLRVLSHRDYGLPFFSSPAKDTLFIASSYSGNTEETIDGFKQAMQRKLPVAVLTTGGRLLDLAKRHGVPYVEMPKTGIQPRSALGFAMLGFAAIMKKPALQKELSALARTLRPRAIETKGKALAKRLSGRVPVMYAGSKNAPIAYNWKIKFNETGKVPAFLNVFPELNHNEMTGFDTIPATKKLSERFSFLFLKGKEHPQIEKRMKVTAKLYAARGLPVEVLSLSGKGIFEQIFNSLLLADWAAYYTGVNYGAETEQVPMVEEFKHLIS